MNKKIKVLWGIVSGIAVIAAFLVFALLPYSIKPDSSSSQQKTSPKKTDLLQIDNVSFDSMEISNLIKEICSDYSLISFGNKTTDGEYSTFLHVPQSMHALTGLDKNTTYVERMNAADAIKPGLPKKEQRVLLYFLHKKLEDDNLKNLQFNAVKNQTILALMRQKPFPRELILHLIGIYHDDSMDMTIRDYCIQFLGQTYTSISEKKYRLAVKQTLFDALKFNQNIAGAAIIAIDGLVGEAEFTHSEIADTAYKLVADEKTSHIVKVSALQIAAKHNHPEALNLARQILTVNNLSTQKLPNSRTPPTPVILKMSAIATIGSKGNIEDVALIEKYRKSSDTRLRTASKATLKKLFRYKDK